MMKDTTFNRRRTAALVAVLAAAGSLGIAVAQTEAVSKPAAPATAMQPANLLSLSEIESRLSARGIKIKEIEARDLVLEVEGYDAQGRELDLIVDRRNGEVLSQRFDND
jgi:hypothetical protein